MEIGAMVQARMSSRRLPGKVLHEVAGKPLLQYLLERLERSERLDAVVVATSTDESDDAIETFCRERQISCHRGSLRNVAERFKDALETYRFHAFVRVNADSPLLDAKVIDRGVGIFLDGDFDVVTNVVPRSYPPGQSVEILLGDAFRRGVALMRSAEEFEHVTPFFYQHPEQFKICNFKADRDYTGMDLTVDSVDGLNRIATILAAMTRPHWEYGLREIREIYASVFARAGSGE